MAKNVSVLTCTECGWSTTRWVGRCAQCQAWGSLTEAARRPLKKFSGGMRRRLDLAASLLAQPPLIFLDEPTTGLDPGTRGQMWDTIRTLVRDGATVLLTTQYLEEADQLADRLVVIDHGKTVAEGTPEELKSSVGSSTLVVDLETANDTPAAREVLERVLGAGALFVDGGRLNAPLPDANVAIDALSALREARIAVRSVQVSKPSLDEVFLTLTGRPVEEHDADDDAATSEGRVA